MKKILALGTLFLLAFTVFSQSKKILIIATNRDSVGANKSGTYLMEIAYPFKYFTDKGIEVDILTPKGGQTSLYDNGKISEDLERIKNDEFFIKKAATSLSPNDVKVGDYMAVFYPGGHGQYFDVMNDERIAKITADIYENGGILGTAGHGVASLINVRLGNQKFLVDGKTITCFPAWAEKLYMNISEFGKLLPFDMQEVLARRGADLKVCTYENRSDKQYTHVIDPKNRIVTGAFASSAQWVAEEVFKQLKF